MINLLIHLLSVNWPYYSCRKYVFCNHHRFPVYRLAILLKAGLADEREKLMFALNFDETLDLELFEIVDNKVA